MNIPLGVDENIPIWTPFPFKIPNDVFIDEPTQLTVVVKIEKVEKTIGQIIFGFAKVPKFTEDKIEAIKSSPNATKTVRSELKCKNCQSTLRVYAGLEKQEDL